MLEVTCNRERGLPWRQVGQLPTLPAVQVRAFRPNKLEDRLFAFRVHA